MFYKGRPFAYNLSAVLHANLQTRYCLCQAFHKHFILDYIVFSTLAEKLLLGLGIFFIKIPALSDTIITHFTKNFTAFFRKIFMFCRVAGRYNEAEN